MQGPNAHAHGLRDRLFNDPTSKLTAFEILNGEAAEAARFDAV